MKEINDSNYYDFVKDGMSLLKIGSTWCQPCKTIEPIVEGLSTEYTGIKFGKMDADQSPDTMTKLQIRSIPTIIIYKNGLVVDKHVGMASKKQLSDILDKHS